MALIEALFLTPFNVGKFFAFRFFVNAFGAPLVVVLIALYPLLVHLAPFAAVAPYPTTGTAAANDNAASPYFPLAPYSKNDNASHKHLLKHRLSQTI